MMHSMRLYNNDLGGRDYPQVVGIFILSLVATIVFAIIAWPPALFAGAGTVFFLSLGVFVSNLILHNTHMARKLSPDHIRLYNTYRSMPKELKAGIEINMDILRTMRPMDAENIRFELDRAIANHDDLKDEEAKFSGPTYALKQQVKELREKKEQELKATREVSEEMRELM